MFTVEIYKTDKRTKSGERLYHKADHDTDNLSMLEHSVKHTWLKRDGFRYEIHETFVTRKNMMGGAKKKSSKKGSKKAVVEEVPKRTSKKSKKSSKKGKKGSKY
jgi:hypothetical protein